MVNFLLCDNLLLDYENCYFIIKQKYVVRNILPMLFHRNRDIRVSGVFCLSSILIPWYMVLGDILDFSVTIMYKITYEKTYLQTTYHSTQILLFG